MGCTNVHIMNGTFGKWKFEDRETNYFEAEDQWHKIAGEKRRRRSHFFDQIDETDEKDLLNKHPDDDFRLDYNQVASQTRLNRLIKLNRILVPEDHFYIFDTKPREYYDLGHVPTAINFAAKDLLLDKHNRHIQTEKESYKPYSQEFTTFKTMDEMKDGIIQVVPNFEPTH